MIVFSILWCKQGVPAAEDAQESMKSTRQMLMALLSAALCTGVAHAATRELLATSIIEDISVPYNAAIVGSDPLNQLSFSDPRVQRTVSGLAPEQVRQRRQACCSLSASARMCAV